MSKVGSRSAVSKYFYQNGESVVITSDIWERDPEYPKGFLPHIGYDYRAAVGTPVVACFDGEIANAVTGLGSDYGRQIFLYNGAVKKTAHYAHLQKVIVAVGTKVKKGQLIGYSGASGKSENTYAAHLHFGIAKGRVTNATNKGKRLGDIWLDVELFHFLNVDGLMNLRAFNFTDNVNVRSGATLKASKKDMYYKGETLKMLSPVAHKTTDGYSWLEYKSSRGTLSAVAVYDAESNEWYGNFQ